MAAKRGTETQDGRGSPVLEPHPRQSTGNRATIRLMHTKCRLVSATLQGNIEIGETESFGLDCNILFLSV